MIRNIIEFGKKIKIKKTSIVLFLIGILLLEPDLRWRISYFFVRIFFISSILPLFIENFELGFQSCVLLKNDGRSGPSFTSSF